VVAQIDDVFIIFDSGTGIRVFGNHIVKTGTKLNGHLFMSHMHWDHIQGFPFFVPAYIPGNTLNIYEHEDISMTLEIFFKHRMMKSPNFPVEMKEMGATINFIPMKESVEIRSDDTIIAIVKNIRLNHPDPTLGYSIEDVKSQKRFVYATDTEHFHEKTIDENLRKFVTGADVLLYDAQYTDEEYYGHNQKMVKQGWGHSTWKEGLKIASASLVSRLLLCHHDPEHDDEMLTAIENEAKIYLKENRLSLPGVESVEMAYEGLVIDLD